MCGILGIVGRPLGREHLSRMALSMRHRGPDAGGAFHWGLGAFAHRRLSILDTSPHANQPFLDPQGRAVLVFNGEIYNYQELRHELTRLGHAFRTTSDTEVLLAGYLQWGERCVERLNGMFAFAVWDFRRHQLFLGRDRFGKKPLFVARLPDGAVLFGSELKPFLVGGLVDSAIDPEAALDYLQLNYVLAPKTMLKHVRQLPAAHMATWEHGVWRERSYWDLADSFQDDRWADRPDELAARLEALLTDATRRRLFSDVPLGAFLSGGVDSSLVVALMKQAGAGDRHTFSVEFPAAAFNEGAFSRLAANHLGTQHHPLLIEDDLTDLLAEFAERMDVPLGDDSAISTFLLSRWARREVTVALSGDGADELFAGYVTYQADALHRALGPLRRPSAWLLRVLGPRLPEGGAKLSRRFRTAQFAAGLAQTPLAAHYRWRQVASAEHDGWMGRDLQAAAPGYDPAATFFDYFQRVPRADWLDRMLYVDCKTWLPDDILVKVDRASMAASLECRSPYLDYEVAEFAARLPRRMKLHWGQKKVLLRALARRHLPTIIVDRKKAGFNSPTTEWLRGPLRGLAEDIFHSDALSSLGIDWRPERWQAFLGGDRRGQYSMWGLLMLGLWRRHVHATASATAAEPLLRAVS